MTVHDDGLFTTMDDDTTLAAVQRADALRHCLSKLTERSRDLIRRRYFECLQGI